MEAVILIALAIVVFILTRKKGNNGQVVGAYINPITGNVNYEESSVDVIGTTPGVQLEPAGYDSWDQVIPYLNEYELAEVTN